MSLDDVTIQNTMKQLTSQPAGFFVRFFIRRTMKRPYFQIYVRSPLNGIASDWRQINAGVPRGSVLGPLLTDNISSEMRLFADDSPILLVLKA